VRRHRAVADAEPEEGAAQLGFDLVGGDVHVVGAQTGQSHVEDEIRIGQRTEPFDEGGLRAEGGQVELERLEAGAADAALLDRHGLRLARDRASRAGHCRLVAVDGDRLRGAL
jgi:hypothetical protein